MNAVTKYPCMWNNYCLIPSKIHDSGLNFHLAAAETEDGEADSRDETAITYGWQACPSLWSRRQLEYKLPGYSTVLKDSGFGLLRFQLSEVLENSFKHSQHHFGRFGKRPIHLNLNGDSLQCLRHRVTLS